MNKLISRVGRAASRCLSRTDHRRSERICGDSTPAGRFNVRCSQPLLAFIVPTALVLVLAPCGVAQQRLTESEVPPTQSAVADYSSTHLLVHTDLPKAEARRLLQRLEATLRTVSRYWGRRASRTNRIECFVANRLDNWPDSDFPHAFGRTLIAGVGGGSFSEGRPGRSNTGIKVTVYSSATPGIAEHEVVHAYCGQIFGTAGPAWYKEGMAELAYHDRTGAPGLQCDRAVIDGLNDSEFRSVRDIVGMETLHETLQPSLVKMLSDSTADDVPARQARFAKWMAENEDSVSNARQSYTWCWSLCHLMSRNPNYARRFRLLGRGYLNRDARSFDEMFGGMGNELEFEHRFFIDRIGIGFRVDLCRWDWTTEFRTIEDSGVASTRVRAAAGFQASGLSVTQGQDYRYRCDGKWNTGDARDLDAAGDSDGRGRLVGVVMNDFRLSDPIELGTRGCFLAPSDGQLYLRCRDSWTDLSDNSGSIRARFELAESGPNASETGSRSAAAE